MKSKSKPKGLGDIVEKFTAVTGIKSAVKTLVGENCGCDERRDKLNEMFPMLKNAEMSKEQMKTWEDLQPALATGRLRGNNSTAFRSLYDAIFEKRHRWCGCGNETPRRIETIKKIYEYSCKE